jgi:hypothetical protein
VVAHLLAERDDGSGRGTYAGVNIDESATAGLDVECPCPPLGGHSLSAASTETRLYARRAGVSGIADSGGVGSLPFAYMGYELTLSRFGNTFLDNQVRQSGVQADRLVIPAPSDVAFDFATDSRVTMLSCADLGDLGEIESPGAGKTLQYWNADFRPYVVGFQDPGPDCPDNPDCPAVIPASCACAEECDVRYVHVDSQAPLELEAGAPAVKRYAEDVPLDFAPAPEGHLVCSDIVPAGSSGSVRNEFEPDYGFSADLTELELLPRNPAAPEDGDAGSRYEVEGETLFPFYGGTASCAVVRSGDVDFRGQCDAPASKVHVSRAILAGLIDLDFHLSYFDPIRAADDDARETGARFLAESASFNLQFFRVPASVKLFGNRPAVGGLPELPERPEVYMGFLSDMAAFAEARGTQDVPCTSGTSCYERLTDLLDLPEGPGGIDDLVPSLRARAAELGDDLRSMAADAMADTVGDVLPADILRIAGRVKGTVDGLRDGAAGSDFFNLENLTGPGTFENITNVEEVQDIVLSRLRLDADIDVTDFFSFKGFAELNRHTANTVDDTDDSADVTIGAHDVDLGWLLDMGRARTIQATFRFDTSPFDVWGFDGRVDLAGLEFGEVTFDTIDLLLGMGNPPTGPEYYYVAGSARGHYKAITAEGGFFFGRSPDIEPILAIDPDVGEMLEGIDSLSGIYLRAEASFPILGGPECAPLRLVGGGGNAYWLFTDGPTFGAKMHAYAHGSLACLVHARGDATLLGGLTDGTWRLAGSGFFAGGVGSCEPEDWRSRRSVLADDWCLACVLDGEFETDSESSKLRGDYHGPTCR